MRAGILPREAPRWQAADVAEHQTDETSKRAAAVEVTPSKESSDVAAPRPGPARRTSSPNKARAGSANKGRSGRANQSAGSDSEATNEEEEVAASDDFFRLMVQGAYRSRKKRDDWTE